MVNIKQTVRRLRREQTNSEFILWQALRNRQLKGKKFIRQFPIIFEIDGEKRLFVADFYCHENKLVVEADGKVHLKQKDYDELRTYIINHFEIKVIRFTNDEVEQNLKYVLEKIKEYL
jgi:very-short-patch-repair endonuclease